MRNGKPSWEDVDKARADEREKLKKLMHYSEHYKEKVLFEDDLKEGK